MPMTDIDRAIARLIIPGTAGGWNYHPFGFKQPGYRVDPALLEEAVRIERSGPARALIGIGAIAALLYIVLPNLAEVRPALIALANSPVIRLAVAVPLLALVYFLVMARRRMMLQKLLAGRMAQAPPLAPAAILARRVQNWRAIPLFSRIAMFVAIPLGALAMALYAAQRAVQVDGLAACEAGLATVFAVALVALYGWLIYRAMSLRGAGRTEK
jgi:hypothetical protein